MNALSGQTLGQYRIIEPIGRGGMASVYKAYQPALDRYVAIKVLPPYYAHEPGFAMRFTREAKAVAKLDHPHILPIYDFGQEGDLSYIVMKYVAAGTLKDMLGRPVPVTQAAELIGQIAAALDHAHEQGIIHRDVKPSNVLMDRGQWALLMDFGLAKMVEGSVQLTASGVGVGTPAYMAPEQGQGGSVDRRADVYSLGIVLYEMLTGKVPFDAETPLAVVLKHITAPLPMPHTINPAIPEPVERVILKSLAKEPDGRYATAGEMAAALQRALVEAEAAPEIAIPLAEAVPLPEEPVVPVAVEATARRKLPRWVFAVGAVALLALVVGVLLATGVFSGGGKPPPEATTTLAAAGQPTALLLPAQPSEGQIIFAQEGAAGWQLCLRDATTRVEHPLITLSDFSSVGGPTWSPDGQRILFSANPGTGWNDLYTVRGDGTELAAVLVNSQFDFADASWSPDGEWIAMHANCALWIARADGTDATDLHDPNEFERCVAFPVWSPDGQMIAFTEQPCEMGASPRLVQAINRDGRGLITLVSIEEKSWGQARVAWSPDGRQISFDGSADEGEQWYLVNADGSGEPQPITEMPLSWFPDFWPQWGKEISIAKPDTTPPQEPIAVEEPPPEARDARPCDWDGLGPGLCIFGWEGGEPARILQDAGLELTSAASWSPDGQQLAFSAFEPGAGPERRHAIFIVNADGTDLRVLPSDRNDVAPAWSPNGEWLAFYSDCDLALIHPDGSDFTVIWPHDDRCTMTPQWSPDGEWLAFSLTPAPAEEWTLPMTRELWVISRDGEILTPVAAVTYQSPDCIDDTIAFSPDGAQVAYFDADCRPMIVNADGTGQAMPLADFPYWWTSSVHPQWGGEAETPSVAATLTQGSPAEAARAFAEPILATVAGRPPDYVDDFSDPGSGWPVGSTADGDEWGYEDGAYSIVVGRKEHDAGAQSDRELSLSDFVLEVEARFVSGEWGHWQVLFRDSPSTVEHPGGAHYGVKFHPDGTFGMWKHLSGAHIELLETAIYAPVFEQGTGTNRLTLIARGPQIAVYMNGEPLWFVTDESSSRGQFQLGAYNFTDIPLWVEFDNLRIWDISDLS